MRGGRRWRAAGWSASRGRWTACRGRSTPRWAGPSLEGERNQYLTRNTRSDRDRDRERGTHPRHAPDAKVVRWRHAQLVALRDAEHPPPENTCRRASHTQPGDVDASPAAAPRATSEQRAPVNTRRAGVPDGGHATAGTFSGSDGSGKTLRGPSGSEQSSTREAQLSAGGPEMAHASERDASFGVSRFWGKNRTAPRGEGLGSDTQPEEE